MEDLGKAGYIDASGRMKSRQKAAKSGGKEARGEAEHRHQDQNDKFAAQSHMARLKEHASECETMDKEPGKDEEK